MPPPKRAHALVEFMRLTAADMALREELPPRPSEVFASGLSPPDAAGGASAVATEGGKGGGESDAAILIEAELIFYGGAGRYATSRRQLANFVERDQAAKQLQRKALLSICRPRAGRRRGTMGREAAAVVIQNAYRHFKDVDAERRGLPKPSELRAKAAKGRRGGRGGGSSRKKKETYEEIIRRLRMSMYVRKIQMLFRSPAYQRQAYLRRKAALKMQALLRQRQSKAQVHTLAKAKADVADGVMRRHGGLAQMDALDVIIHHYHAYKAGAELKKSLFELVSTSIDASWRAMREGVLLAKGWSELRALQKEVSVAQINDVHRRSGCRWREIELEIRTVAGGRTRGRAAAGVWGGRLAWGGHRKPGGQAARPSEAALRRVG